MLTLSQRRENKRLAIADGLVSLKSDLKRYVSKHGGCFILYGSAARGDFRFSSDVDILVDSPTKESESDAWVFAENACFANKLIPDVRSVSFCKDSFVEAIMKHAEIINA